MTFASIFLGALLTTVVTNSPSSFSTETEYVLPCPSLAERDAWLTCEITPDTAVSNRLSIAFGSDAADGPSRQTPLALVLDGVHLNLSSPEVSSFETVYTALSGAILLDIHPGKGDDLNSCEIMTNGVSAVTVEWPSAHSDIRSWNAVCVRMSGPDPATANITLRRRRRAINIFIR